jgi:hypothetical protein
VVAVVAFQTQTSSELLVDWRSAVPVQVSWVVKEEHDPKLAQGAVARLVLLEKHP